MYDTSFWVVWAKRTDSPTDHRWQLVSAWMDQGEAHDVATNLSKVIERPTAICRAKTTHGPEYINAKEVE